MRADAWLGERLGCAAWTVESGDTVEDVLMRGTGFFQAKVSTDQVARVGSLEQAGFRTIDVNVTFRREPGDLGGDADGANGAVTRVRDAAPADRDAVVGIAERDYTVSRFHLDPQIPDRVAGAIKRDWADNFFHGARGDQLLVAEANGEVIGFLLGLDATGMSIIDLVAVATEARGRGAGRTLVAGLVQSRPDRAVVAGTQVANVGALRFYERLGFTVQQTQFVLHRHA
jgi:ribosomal protein S18 acetylase RimI-like enzyme